MQNGYIGSILTPTRERKKRRNVESLRMYVSENSFKIYYTLYLCVFFVVLPLHFNFMCFGNIISLSLCFKFLSMRRTYLRNHWYTEKKTVAKLNKMCATNIKIAPQYFRVEIFQRLWWCPKPNGKIRRNFVRLYANEKINCLSSGEQQFFSRYSWMW